MLAIKLKSWSIGSFIPSDKTAIPQELSEELTDLVLRAKYLDDKKESMATMTRAHAWKYAIDFIEMDGPLFKKLRNIVDLPDITGPIFTSSTVIITNPWAASMILNMTKEVYDLIMLAEKRLVKAKAAKNQAEALKV